MSAPVYLYGFVPSAATLPSTGLAGIAGTTVELLWLDGFAAAIGRPASEDFEPAALEQHTRDLRWVGLHGLEHEAVVAWFVDHAQILPAPLFTLYSSDAALRAAAGERRPVILRLLESFVGLREWDLKVTCPEPDLRAHAAELSPAVAELDQRMAAAAPGTRFLLERKREDLLRAGVTDAARRLAHELLEQVRPAAARVRTLPLARTPEQPDVVLNAALLVPADGELALRERVAARAAALAPLGVQVAFSGPWAPYRFLDEEAPLA